MPAATTGVALSPEEQEQLRDEYKRLIEAGHAPIDAKRTLASRWQRSESRIHNLVRGVAVAKPAKSELEIAAPVRQKLEDLEDDDPRIQELIEAERDTAKWKAEATALKKRNRTLENDLLGARDLLAKATELGKARKPVKIAPGKRSKGEPDGEAVAVAVASDWHMGAIIRPNTVNFLNEVHPEITQARIERYFRALVSLVRKEQAHVRINTLVLALIGDFIENYLHPELIEEAVMSPIEQMMAVQAAIIGGFEYLLANTELKIIAPTCTGNHGRTTEDRRASTEYKNSYEQLLYWSLEKHFLSEPRVTFQVTDSYFNYLDVYDHTLRFHHGHSVRFGGGVGGLLIPLRKFIHRANQQIYADTSICGHFHSLLMDYDIMVNGSLVGPSAYSIRLGFAPERPQQIFRLLDSRRGWTVFAPILVAEQEKKSGKIIG
jgi:hypothetical protein